MKYIPLVCLLLMGCDQAQTVGLCANSVPNTSDGGSAKHSEGVEGNGSATLIADGGPCNVNDDCESAACLPSQNSFSYGYCYSPAMVGCIVITEPSPMKAQCAPLAKLLYVCGDNQDVSQWDASCVDVGIGQFNEHYHCCSKL